MVHSTIPKTQLGFSLNQYLNIIILVLEREIDEFEEKKVEAGDCSTTKPIKEFDTVTLYLIAGKLDVFLLGENEEEWAQRLTEEEIKDLPMEIYWTGPKTNFEVSSRKATELCKLDTCVIPYHYLLSWSARTQSQA